MNSFFRNWHKAASWRQTKKQSLCDTWWPKAEKREGIEITFTEGFRDQPSKQITFHLSEEHASHLYKQLTNILTDRLTHLSKDGCKPIN